MWKFTSKTNCLENKRGSWMYQNRGWIVLCENVEGYLESTTGQVLGVLDNKKEQGTVVNLETKCDSFDGQKWMKGEENSDGYFTLKNVNSNKYLTAETPFKTIIADKFEVKKHSLTQTGFNKVIVEYIIKRREALTLVNNEAFRELMLSTHQNPDLKMPTYSNVVEIVDKRFNEMMSKMRNLMEEAGHLGLTTDGWTAVKKCFLGYTVSWITPDLKRKGFALACRRHIGRKTHDKVGLHIYNVLLEFDLLQKTRGMTVDGGSEYQKAFEVFGPSAVFNEEVEEELQFEGEQNANDIQSLNLEDLLSEDNNEIHLPEKFDCFCHKLNRIGKSDIKCVMEEAGVLCTMFTKLKKVITKQNKSNQKADIIREHCGGLFISPGETRWNSEFYCVQDFLKKYEKNANEVQVMLGKLGVPRFLSSEITAAQEYVKVLKPVATGINECQTEDVIGIGLCLPTIIGIKIKLSKLRQLNNLVHAKPLLECVISSMETRFNDYFTKEKLIIAAISAPQFKAKWIANPVNKAHAVDLLKREVEKLTGPATQPQLVEDQSAHSDLYDFEENDTQGSEVDEFLSCKNRTLTIFNNDSFPNVKRVFMKFNAPEASSARSERLFSGGKLIFETKRTSLGDANFEKLLLLSVNKDL